MWSICLFYAYPLITLLVVINSVIIDKPNINDQNIANNVGEYNIKTIAARHTRHKSMLCNMSANYDTDK